MRLFVELKAEEDWTALGFADTFDVSLHKVNDNVERIDAAEVTHEEFVRDHERPYKPVVIRNAQKNWKAVDSWTPEVSTAGVLVRLIDRGVHNSLAKCVFIRFEKRDLCCS